MRRYIFLALFSVVLCPSMAFAQAEGTLAKIKETGVITLGYRESSVPFSYLNGTAPVGLSIDLCQKVVEEVKRVTGRADLNVRMQGVSAANRIPLLQNGTIDLECGNTTNNIERNKQVAFSINTYYTGTTFLVKKGSSIRSIADLKGKKVAGQTGTTNLLVVRKLDREKNLDMNMSVVKDHSEGVLMLQSGRIDAYLADDIVLIGLRSKISDPENWEVVGEPLQVEPCGLVMRKDDLAFKKLVDGVLMAAIKGGEFKTLYKKWFNSPIPPAGTSLGLPMSAQFEETLNKLSDQPAF